MTDWIGSTVAQVLARCRAHYSEVQLIDEPPGKLRLIKFTVVKTTRRKSSLRSSPDQALFRRPDHGGSLLSRNSGREGYDSTDVCFEYG